MLKACIGLNCARQIDYIDRRHCGLTFIPDDVYRHERTLEELLLDYNSLQELPPKLFRLTNLRKLTVSENDIIRIPPGIANLVHLVELDLSKNAIEDIPQNMQFCRSLALLDVSSNPLLRTPETISTIPSLTQLCLNDVAIPRLPLDIGNLKNLIVLEARENALKTVPASVGALKKLRRLDVGNNEIEFLPSELGELEELTELWLDSNCLSELPESVSQLLNLAVLDVTKNKLERLPEQTSRLKCLSDLHASENCIEVLPNDIGELKALTLLKLDFNHLTELPESIGNLHQVTELLLFDNMLESIPASLFQMKSLEMLNLDRNHLMEIPTTVGQCRRLHVLSLRENELLEVPEEVGQLEELTVLDVVGNRLNYLPVGLSALNLDALWIDGSQPQPLIALHPEPDPNNPEKKRLTCLFLPQQGPHSSSLENFLDGSESPSEERSATNSLSRTGSFGKGVRLGVAFDPSLGPGEAEPSKFVRFPTPFRRDMKARRKKGKFFKPDATPSTTIFKKGSSADDLTLLSTSSAGDQDTLQREASLRLGGRPAGILGDVREVEDESPLPGLGSQQNGEVKGKDSLNHTGEGSIILVKASGMEDLAQEEEAARMDLVQRTPSGALTDTTPDLLKNAVYADGSSELPGSSQLQTIEVTIELEKVPGRTLGFSIAGGRGSTPAYEDVDQSIFITKIAQGGLAEQDGRLRLGDKLISVNEQDMTDSTHAESVAALKRVTDVCLIVVSREVLVVMPEDEDESNAETLPTPKTKLTFSPPPEETEGESFAKKIVSEILGRSVERIRDSFLEEEATQNGNMEREQEGEQGKSPYDNYVNYDIAQTVLESTAVRESQSPPAEEEESPLPSRETPAKDAGPDIPEPVLPLITSTPIASDGLEERVVLDRSIGILGLSVVGGADHASRVFGQGKPGVYISKITKGGAAHATGKLRLGDHIIEVNGSDVRNATHQQAVQWLVSQQGDIELLVRHVPQPEGLQEVVIQKDTNEKLGISIRGGSKGSKGNPLDVDDEGIFISKITDGGAAERDGQLQVGHRILEVNGVSLLGASHLEAVKALRSSPDQLSIIVCNGYDPKEVLRRRQSEQDAASRSLDDAVFRLLSESVDAIPQRSLSTTLSPVFTVPGLKLSRSSTDINEKPVTAEDLDRLLTGLAKFREIETSKPASEPPEPLLVSPTLPTTTSDILPLQEDLLGVGVLGEDLPDIPVQDEDSEPGTPVFRERSPSLEKELSKMEEEDTASLLATLDDEVSHMQDEVSIQESELQQAGKEEEPKPKPKHHLKPASGAVRWGAVSPETRRRADEIKIKIDLPSDRRASAEAVESIIGEVFNDVSFDEFEDEAVGSGPASGILTPSAEALRSMSPDPNPPASFQELLSALQGLGESTKAEEKPVIQVEKVELKTETKEEAAAPTSYPVQLRVPTTHRDPQKRKSAPPKVADKPTHWTSPERLSFHEKVALYKRSEQEESGRKSPSRPGSAKDPGNQQKGTGMLPVKRTSSDGGTVQPTGKEEHLKDRTDNMPLSARIASLQASQAKAGMQPVGVHVVTSEDSRLSAEERRLARVMNLASVDKKMAQPHNGLDVSSPVKTEPKPQSPTEAKHSVPSQSSALTEDHSEATTNADNSSRVSSETNAVESSVDPDEYGTPVDLVTVPKDTSNNATKINKPSEVDSPYVAQVLANMPALVQPPQDEELKEDKGEEWEKRRAWRKEKTAQLQEQVHRVESLLKEAREQSELEREDISTTASETKKVENHTQ